MRRGFARWPATMLNRAKGIWLFGSLALLGAPLMWGAERPGPVSAPSPHEIVYVDDDAPPGGSGRNWQQAIRYLQDALDLAERSRGRIREIRVAQGEYKPDQGLWVEPLDQEATFFLVDGVALRGGYRGHYAGPGNPNQRDIDAFLTYLSGDLLGDGIDYDDNSFHIVTAMYVGPDTEVEGFTIHQATDDPDGLPPEPTSGAFLAFGGNPLVQRCIFADNRGHAMSGSVVLVNSNTIFRKCLFTFNLSNMYAGAMTISQGEPVIEDCQFINNVAFYESAGAISMGASAAKIRKCLFLNNWAGNEGGAMSVSASVQAEMTDCDFIDNVAGWGGGAVRHGGLLRRCRFISNSAGMWGGAFDGGGRLIDCLFEGNQTSQGGGAIYGGGDLVNCIFRGNAAGASSQGGGGALMLWTHTTLTNCLLVGNHSNGAGGAILFGENLAVVICNSTIVGNSGGGSSGQAVLGVGALRNSIVWANAGGSIGSGITASHSCIEGGAPGAGNIDKWPAFVNMLGLDATAGTADDDLRLSRVSPCIDTANVLLLPPDQFDMDSDGNVTEPVPVDLAHHARIIPGRPASRARVDMGAFEFVDPVRSTSSRPAHLTP